MAIKFNSTTITVNKLNNVPIQVESLNGVPVYDTRPPLSKPDGSLADKFDYEDGMDLGGVMLIGLYNPNPESVTLRGRILFGGNDATNNFTHFELAEGYFFGDTFPPNKGLDYGLSVISQGLFINDWSFPITVEVWFEPQSGSSRSASDKLIITVNS